MCLTHSVGFHPLSRLRKPHLLAYFALDEEGYPCEQYNGNNAEFEHRFRRRGIVFPQKKVHDPVKSDCRTEGESCQHYAVQHPRKGGPIFASRPLPPRRAPQSRLPRRMPYVRSSSSSRHSVSAGPWTQKVARILTLRDRMVNRKRWELPLSIREHP